MANDNDVLIKFTGQKSERNVPLTLAFRYGF